MSAVGRLVDVCTLAADQQFSPNHTLHKSLQNRCRRPRFNNGCLRLYAHSIWRVRARTPTPDCSRLCRDPQVVQKAPDSSLFSPRTPIGEPSRAHGTPSSWSQVEQRGKMVREIRDILHRAVEQGKTPASHDTATSHWRYWTSSCQQTRISAERFGALDMDDAHISDAQLIAETEVLSAFASFIVFYPRRASRGRNTAMYAEQVIALVRSSYELRMVRRPGLNS